MRKRSDGARRLARRPDRATRWVSRASAEDGSDARRLLLLCDYRPHEAATVIDHIDAIRRWSRASVHVLPIYGDIPDGLDLEAFDGLIIHYNVVMTSNWHLSPLARWRIRRFKGVKAAFIQDEYRFVDDTVSVLRTLRVDVLFSCVPSGEVEKVYPHTLLPDLRRTVNVLTGYVPEALTSARVLPYEARPLDVGYRGRRLPPWLGELAQEKAIIADRFLAEAPGHGLIVDISCNEEDRLYGPAWIDFVSRSKAMLGVESGASVFDFDGSIERSVRQHLAVYPGTPFAELRRRFFADAEGRIRLNQISPRCFEAAALGTLMILYPGDYSGILQPWRHYVPLEKDHSNMVQVVDAIRDPALWTDITRRARDEVALNPLYSYQALAKTVDSGLDLQPIARASIAASAFDDIASHSYEAMPQTRLHAFGLPPAVNRIRLMVERAARLVTPNATLVAPSTAYDSERMPSLRNAIRRARALLYWGLRPRELSWSSLARGGHPLLEDLAELRRIQDIGRRAIATTGVSPYVLVLDRGAGELRCEVRPDTDQGGDVLEALPEDLSWARVVRLDLGDRWLVPSDRPERSHTRLEGMSNVLQQRPEVGRRLIASGGAWCSVARVAEPT